MKKRIMKLLKAGKSNEEIKRIVSRTKKDKRKIRAMKIIAGMFTWVTSDTDRVMIAPFILEDFNEPPTSHGKQVVTDVTLLLPSGKKVSGTYDGYGRLGDVDVFAAYYADINNIELTKENQEEIRDKYFAEMDPSSDPFKFVEDKNLNFDDVDTSDSDDSQGFMFDQGEDDDEGWEDEDDEDDEDEDEEEDEEDMDAKLKADMEKFNTGDKVKLAHGDYKGNVGKIVRYDGKMAIVDIPNYNDTGKHKEIKCQEETLIKANKLKADDESDKKDIGAAVSDLNFLLLRLKQNCSHEGHPTPDELKEIVGIVNEAKDKIVRVAYSLKVFEAKKKVKANEELVPGQVYTKGTLNDFGIDINKIGWNGKTDEGDKYGSIEIGNKLYYFVKVDENGYEFDDVLVRGKKVKADYDEEKDEKLDEIKEYAKDIMKQNPAIDFKDLANSVLDVSDYKRILYELIGNEYDVRLWLEDNLEEIEDDDDEIEGKYIEFIEADDKNKKGDKIQIVGEHDNFFILVGHKYIAKGYKKIKVIRS